MAFMFSLVVICTMLMSACRSNGGNVNDPDDGNGNKPDDGKDLVLDFDPFSAEIYGVYLSDLDWEPNSLAGWVDDKGGYPQGHLCKDKT